MRILPTDLKFESIKPGVLYAMTFSIVNTTKIAHRIRIQAPKNPCFALNYIPSGAVAPGLDIRAEIECQIPDSYPHNFISETIVANMGPHQMEIPIFASKPCAIVNFNQTANIGLIAEGQTITYDVFLENVGEMDGDVEILRAEVDEATQNPNREDPLISITPSVFTLKSKNTPKVSGARYPPNKMKVEIKFQGIELGNFREMLRVKVSGYPDPFPLDVSAQTVLQRLSLLQAGGNGLIDNLEFGTVFYGQSKSIPAVLVNNGPQQVNYFVTYISDDDDKGAGGHNPDEQAPSQERSMILYPSEGIIQPFSQITVSVRFFPELSIPNRGFIKKHMSESHEPKFMSSRASIECAENGKGVTFNMQGTAVMPSYSVSPTVLRFDNCPVYDRRDILVTLQNKSTIPITFDFTKVAHFKMDPMKGSLQPNEVTTIVASFIPGQLGHFASKVTLSISNGLRTTEMHLIGGADDPGKRKQITGGPQKLVDEFTTQYKFVDTKDRTGKLRSGPGKDAPEVNAGDNSTLNVNASMSMTTFTRMAPWDSKEFLASNSWDEVYSTTGGGKGLSGDDPTYSLQELQRRAEHKAKYNEFLQQSHNQRLTLKQQKAHAAVLARNGPDRSNPNGIDMGMNRGLDEPVLRIPRAGDPLWLANGTQDGDGALGGGGRSRIPLDESRLIQKKYHDAPRTQAEIRDCSAELGYEDLKLIISSHKILNFGRVCINSVTAKNFAITNDLQQCVLIKLESNSFEPELRQSRPEAQVVPGGAAAGFDIYFQCHDLGKYKKTFSWSINGNHTYKVGVVAEVVPIELKLDKTKLMMEFPEDSMDKSISEDVVLHNPGNAVAEFLWGANGAFQCFPERGVIDPGQSAVIKVQWTPKQGKSNEDELGLHISGGLDQTLKVIGEVKEAKADFDNKKLSMGIVAVGMEVKMVTNLKNTSANPCVFHFDAVDEKYGLVIRPESGRILPGESFQICVTVNPKAPMSYENVTISADIRGGKPVTLKLSGESKIPELSLVEKTFEFGLVVVGSEFRVPMTLVNKSLISACLILDVVDHPEFTPTMGEGAETHRNGVQKDKVGNILEPFMHSDLHTAFSAADDLNLASPDGGITPKHTQENIWKITLAAGQSFTGSLIFTPTKAETHNFALQLYMQGLQEQEESQFNCQVTADGLASRLGLSTMEVDFGDRVVSRDPSACMTYYKEFTLQNLDALRGLSFTVKDKAEPPRPSTSTDSSTVLSSKPGTGKSKPGTGGSTAGGKRSKGDKDGDTPGDFGSSPPVFVIFPTENSLPSGASTPMRVTFLPQNNGEYVKKLYVYISDQPDTSRPYLTLLCRGSGVFPRLSFDRPQISLPPVPLGITSRSTFTILNNGYDNLVLQYRQSPTIPIPLEVTFPDGQELGLTALKARVNVSCVSESPISWSGKLEFYDNDGERFAIDVSGVADCSLFTCYSFCRGYSDLFGFVGIEDQPIRYMTKKEIMSVRLLDAKHREQNRRALVLERQKQKGGVTTDSKDSVSKDDNDKKRKGKKGKGDDHEQSALAQLETKISHDTEALVDGVILSREAEHELPGINDLEISILLKWLNKYVCRKLFDVNNFLGNVLDTNGDIIIDCIEQMSGRKIPLNTDSGPGQNIISTTNFGDRPDTAALSSSTGRLILKYKALLNYLIKTGALLNQINPYSMLDFSAYMLAHENDLRRVEGERLTPAFLAERRAFYESKWNMLCKQAWGEILFQGVKIFILGKLSYSEFAKMPGVVVNQDFEMEQSMKSGKSKKSRSKYPPEFASSNVHTHGEAVLLAWAGYHIHHAKTLEDEGSSSTASSGVRMLAAGTGRRVIDIDSELSDFYGFCQLVHSHMPESTRPGGALSGYTVGDHTRQSNNFGRFQTGLQAAHLNFDFTVEEIATGRGMLMALLNLFFGLPCMIPKSNIEFRGILGSPIVKIIELKNPSKRKVVYQVSLEGSKDFSIDTTGPDGKVSTQVVVPPESSIDYPVTLTSKFSEQVTARIVFWGLRDSGVAGSTMVFKLSSNIYARKPREVFKRSIGVYDLETIHIDVKNPYDKECSFDMRLSLNHVPTSIQDLLDHMRGLESKNNKNRGKELEAMMNSKLSKKNKDGEEDKEKSEGDEVSSEIEVLFKQPFWCSEYVIFLPAKGSKMVTVNILPFMLGSYSCELVLIEPRTGEFSFEIQVDAGFPKPMDKIDFNVMQQQGGTSPEQVLRLASKNLAFEKAVHVVTEGRISVPARRAKAKSFLLNMISTPIVNDETGESPFIIEMVSPYFVAKKEIAFVSDYGVVSGAPVAGVKHSGASNKYRKVHKTMLDTPSSGVVDIAAMQNSLNTVLFHVKCDQAGVYKTRAIVFARDNHLDMRVLDMYTKVSIARQEMNFYFKGSARQKVTQEIAVQNIANKDWVLSATITGSGFTGPKQLVVPKGDTGIYVLSFTAPYAGSFNGTLVLRNTEADDNFEYKLYGSAEDPHAEDHLHFKCNARSKKSFSIPLSSIPRPSAKEIEAMLLKGQVKERAKDRPNNPGMQYFEIQTDLPYLSGAAYVEVATTGTTDYNFSVLSPVGGVMSGSITFIDPESGIMMWYVVDIEVAPPAAESTIKVESMVRKAVVVEITLDNPTSEEQNFTVKYRGDGLIGDTSFILPPSTNPAVVPYELIYSPLHTGVFNGSISFINDHIGEIWYKLQLTANPAPSTEIELIECMVGTTKGCTVPIENPLPESVTLSVAISDPDHFSVQPESILLGPYAQSSFSTVFRPSSLTETATATITLSHPKFGEISYDVSGRGELPGLMPSTSVLAPLGTAGSHTISFRNPFPHPLPVDVVLSSPTDVMSDAETADIVDPDTVDMMRQSRNSTAEGRSSGEVFSLLLRKPIGLVIAAKSSLQVGISFTPDRLGDYYSFLQVRSSINNRSLLWCFPIVGTAEAGTPQRLEDLVTPCKSSIIQDIEIKLEGLKKEDLAPGEKLHADQFQLVTKVANEANHALVMRALRAQPIELVEVSDQEREFAKLNGDPCNYDYIMKYRLLFEPLKTFNSSTELLITCKNKGRWRAEIDLQSTEPDVDDVIELTAAVGGTDRVGFKLNNRFLGFSSFDAYFTAKSSKHFSVTPTSGVLAPYGAEGTSFVVSFSPTEYGSREKARLMITTEDVEWSYEVNGNYPDFNINSMSISSKVDCGNNGGNHSRSIRDSQSMR